MASRDLDKQQQDKKSYKSLKIPLFISKKKKKKQNPKLYKKYRKIAKAIDGLACTNSEKEMWERD